MTGWLLLLLPLPPLLLLCCCCVLQFPLQGRKSIIIDRARCRVDLNLPSVHPPDGRTAGERWGEPSGWCHGASPINGPSAMSCRPVAVLQRRPSHVKFASLSPPPLPRRTHRARWTRGPSRFSLLRRERPSERAYHFPSVLAARFVFGLCVLSDAISLMPHFLNFRAPTRLPGFDASSLPELVSLPSPP